MNIEQKDLGLFPENQKLTKTLPNGNEFSKINMVGYSVVTLAFGEPLTNFVE